MKKQEYFDIGILAGLNPSQIEKVLCKALDVSKETLFVMKDISAAYIYEVQQSFYKIQSWVNEEYELEKANFYGRDFFVDDRVLIPRNDTEVLVKKALEEIHLDTRVRNTVYIDIWTGSACIPISIVKEMHPLKFDEVFALDISPKALEVAKKNIETHNLESIRIRESDLFAWIFHEDILQEKNLFITANLPYIKNGDHNNMDKNVVTQEPDLALYWWEYTGFELYEKLIKQCFQLKQVHKIKNIELFIEIGFDQYEVSKKFLESLGLSFEYFQDNANIQRVIHIEGF